MKVRPSGIAHPNSLLFPAAIAVLALGAACALQAPSPSLELAAFTDDFQEALNNGDVEGLVSLYAPDCRLMPPNGPMMEGHDAVRTMFGAMIDAGLKGELKTVESMVLGDSGYKVGTFKVLLPDGSVMDQGKFMEVWKKTDSGWLMSNDIWNSDMPLPGSGTTLVITHEVKDGDHWLAAWSGENSRHDMFAANGAADIRVFQNPEQANQVGLLVEVSDMETFMAFINSPETQAAKVEDGVIDSSLRFHTEVK
jgi:ketosteroid isomerase-like protein